MNVKGDVLLQLYNKRELRNGTKTFLEPKFFSIVKFKKLGFSAPLILRQVYIKTPNKQVSKRNRPLTLCVCGKV